MKALVLAVFAAATSFAAAYAPSSFAERPALSGREETVASADGRFLFHFTRTGVDAVSDRDESPKNGIPDYVPVAFDGWGPKEEEKR